MCITLAVVLAAVRYLTTLLKLLAHAIDALNAVLAKASKTRSLWRKLVRRTTARKHTRPL